MFNQLLTGYRVLDLTDLHGYACGRILASLGAEVIKIEPPAGDPWRDLPHQRVSDRGLFWYVQNTGKQSLSLDLESREGQEIFRNLVRKADVVLESFRPGYLDTLQLGYKSLAEIRPEIIMASITPFGQQGPYANHEGSELVASALSGVLKGIGYPDRAPVKEAGDACIFHACAAAFTATSFALYERGNSGQGQHIDVSIQEVAAARNTVCLLSYQFDRAPHRRAGSLFSNGALPPRRFIWQLRDGHICRALDGRLGGGPSANTGLSEWMDAEGVDNPFREVDWKTATLVSLDPEMRERLDTALERFLATRTVASVEQAIEKYQIGGTLVRRAGEALEDDHLAQRGFFESFPHDEGRLRLPDYFIQAQGLDKPTAIPAPAVGEHNHQILSDCLGMTAEQIQQFRKAGVIGS